MEQTGSSLSGEHNYCTMAVYGESLIYECTKTRGPNDLEIQALSIVSKRFPLVSDDGLRTPFLSILGPEVDFKHPGKSRGSDSLSIVKKSGRADEVLALLGVGRTEIRTLRIM